MNWKPLEQRDTHIPHSAGARRRGTRAAHGPPLIDHARHLMCPAPSMSGPCICYRLASDRSTRRSERGWQAAGIVVGVTDYCSTSFKYSHVVMCLGRVVPTATKCGDTMRGSRVDVSLRRIILAGHTCLGYCHNSSRYSSLMLYVYFISRNSSPKV